MKTFNIKANNKVWTVSAFTKEDAINQIKKACYYCSRGKVEISWVMAF